MWERRRQAVIRNVLVMGGEVTIQIGGVDPSQERYAGGRDVLYADASNWDDIAGSCFSVCAENGSL